MTALDTAEAGKPSGLTRRQVTTIAAWGTPVVLLAMSTSAAAASGATPEVMLSWDPDVIDQEATVTLIINTPADYPTDLETTISVTPAVGDSSAVARFDFSDPSLSATDSGDGFVISSTLDAETTYTVAVIITGFSEGTTIAAESGTSSAQLTFSAPPPPRGTEQ